MRQCGTEAWTKWRGPVAEQKQSGQSVAAFCRERGVPTSQMFSWKRRLREAEVAKFVEVAINATLDTEATAEVRSSAIEVRLVKGRSLVVEPGFDVHHLRALLAVLEA